MVVLWWDKEERPSASPYSPLKRLNLFVRKPSKRVNGVNFWPKLIICNIVSNLDIDKGDSDKWTTKSEQRFEAALCEL